jgi:hypothetical protein
MKATKEEGKDHAKPLGHRYSATGEGEEKKVSYQSSPKASYAASIASGWVIGVGMGSDHRSSTVASVTLGLFSVSPDHART